MKTIVLKVDEKIPDELDVIQNSEGLGNRTSTISYLIKYYFLTQENTLNNSIHTLNTLLDRVDADRLPSAEEQLKGI